MSERDMASADRIAELQAEIRQLTVEHKSDIEVWRNKYGMIQDDLAKAWADKRELVDALERIVAYLRTIGIGTLVTIPLGALITKHKEVAPKS